MGRTAQGAFGLVVVGSAFLFSGPAFAVDPTAVADQLVAAVNDATRIATYETATEADGVVTITGFAVADDPNHTFANVAEIDIVNPVERDEGGFIADTVTLVDGEINDQANTLSWGRVDLSNVTVPFNVDLAAEGPPQIPLTAAAVQNLVFNPPQANDLLIDGVDLQLGDIIEGVPYTVAVTVTNVHVPTEMADNADAVDILKSMGFDSLVMDFTIAGTFDSDTDTLTANSISINIHDFGRVEISGVFSGVPLSMLQDPGGVDAILASAMVNSVHIRFDNGGAMQAFMTIQADMMGVAPEDAAYGLAVAFQLFMQVELPDLDPQIGTTVGAFLRDPRNITIDAVPAEPVPLLAIIPLITGNPNALPTLLDVAVTANDDGGASAAATPGSTDGGSNAAP
jgi:hypothetical protein